MAWQITVQAGEWIDAVAIRSDGHDGFVGWNHRENQSAEAATINTVCKPRRPAGSFFVSEFAPISLTKPFQKERCCLDSSILFGKVL